MRIEILCFGTELLTDKINTNSILIAEKLSRLGYSVRQVSIVGDIFEDAEQSLRGALHRSDLVITCGGLGPTFDDFTRECAAKVIHRPLIFSKNVFRHIRKKYSVMSKNMPVENRKQAYIVKDSKVILNSAGTAPGQIIDIQKKSLILLPGPPRELLSIMDDKVLPFLKKEYGSKHRIQLVLHCFGFAESEIDEQISPVINKKWDQHDCKVVFGILAHRSIIDVKVTVEGPRASKIKQVLSSIRKELKNSLGERVYGENDETLEGVVGNLLKKQGKKLALAESCTGGRIADKITDVPGSSGYFVQGIVAYSNRSKTGLLGVKEKTLKKFGAVSEPAALEMAKGISRKSKAYWTVSVTGIAGPGGGSADKPVGTVCFCVGKKQAFASCTRHFIGTRAQIKERAALTALNFLRKELLN